MTHTRRSLAMMLVVCLATSAAAEADWNEPSQQVPTPETVGDHAVVPPDTPPVLSRDDAGRVTVRAIRLAEPLVMDGSLDESIYQTVPAITEFFQQVPDEGSPATEKTEVWVMFDGTNIYVAARCWDSAPPDEIGRAHVWTP